jgi:hypothetical protein
MLSSQVFESAPREVAQATIQEHLNLVEDARRAGAISALEAGFETYLGNARLWKIASDLMNATEAISRKEAAIATCRELGWNSCDEQGLEAVLLKR